jgi:hypothetical protein
MKLIGDDPYGVGILKQLGHNMAKELQLREDGSI